MEEKELNNSINDNEMPEQQGQETTVSNEREKKITRFVKIARICLIITSAIMLFYLGEDYKSKISSLYTYDPEQLLWFLATWAITIFSIIKWKKLPSLVASELDKDIAHHLNTVRICLVIVSVYFAFYCLERETSGHGVDEEYLIWYCVIWAITILMFIFKKKLPSLVERVVDFVKKRNNERRESKKKQ